MGKRYKANNVGKRKKVKPRQIFFKREKRIAHLINKFMDIIFHRDVNDLNNYDEANRLRLNLKMELDIQSKYLSGRSRRRRNVYYLQLEKFKTVYTIWKARSYPAYCIRRYDLPCHLLESLVWFYEGIKKRYAVSYSIF